MALTLVYPIFQQLLAWLTLMIRNDTTKTAENLLQRHKTAVLRRQVKRPRRSRADRAPDHRSGRAATQGTSGAPVHHLHHPDHPDALAPGPAQAVLHPDHTSAPDSPSLDFS
jgi:hypothetical protein